MRTPRSALACIIALPIMAAAPAAAQEVQYETVTKLELPGAVGTAMRLAARLGGGSMETVSKTMIKGNRMRTDVDRSSTIMDLDGKRVISIDHDAKTYWVSTFEEMIATANEASEALRADAQKRTDNPSAEAQLNFRFAVDDARERERIAGYDASRFFLTMEAEGEYVPEDAQPGAAQEKSGKLIVLTELWSSKDIPVFGAQQAFDQATGRELANASDALMQGIAAAFAEDPQLQVAFEQSTREAMKIEGIPVRSVVRFISVAPDKQFDRNLAVAPKGDGGSTAGRAARAGLGRLGRAAAGAAASAAGAAGGTGRQQEQSAQEPTQVTFMTVISELRNVSTRGIDASLFEPPAGYRQIEMQ